MLVSGRVYLKINFTGFFKVEYIRLSKGMQGELAMIFWLVTLPPLTCSHQKQGFILPALFRETNG